MFSRSFRPLFAILLVGLLAFGLFAVAAHQGPVAAGLLFVALNVGATHIMGGFSGVFGANSLGTLSPGVLSMTMLQRLQKKYPPVNAFATDFSDKVAKFGDPITARVAVKPTVSDYSSANGYVAGSASTTDVPVTINKHKHVSLSFNSEEISGTNRKLTDEQLDGAVTALGEQVLSDVFALVTVGNFTTTPVTETINNHDRETLTAVRKALTGAGAGYPRNGFCSDEAFEKLTNDAKIISSDYVKQDPDYEGGIITNVAGFRSIFEYPDLPNTSNMVGFYCNPAALVIATRLPDDPASLMADLGIPMTGVVVPIKDPRTGLSMLLRYHYNMQRGTLQMDLVLMYGVALGVVGHGVIVITS
jgi:hypothetical protein